MPPWLKHFSLEALKSAHASAVASESWLDAAALASYIVTQLRQSIATEEAEKEKEPPPATAT